MEDTRSKKRKKKKVSHQISPWWDHRKQELSGWLNIHWNLGSSKNFKCPYCNFELDRDWNGARNIFLMNVERSIGLVSKKNPSSEGGSCNLQTTSS